MKKLALVFVVLIILGAGGAYLVLRSGVGGADDWVVRRVVKIAETYIQPKIDFDGFAWDGSRTISLEGVTLTADDGTEVLTARSMIVTTERVPVTGGPFIIEGVTLEDATLRLIQTTGSDGGIAFKGLVPFTRGENIENQDQVASDVKLSESFQIRDIVLKNGGFEYDAGDGSEPMRLAGIDIDVDLTPGEGGLYLLQTVLDQGEVLTMNVKADADLDNMILTNTDVSMSADLTTAEAVSALPPQIQTLLRQYEIKGKMNASVTGTINANAIGESDMRASFGLRNSNVSFGEYKIPVDNATIEAKVAGGSADISTFGINMIGGSIELTRATLDLNNAAMPFDAAWRIRGLRIEDFLRSKPEGEPLPMGGILASSGSVRGSLSDLPGSISSGPCELTMREGRLVSIPIITDIIDVMDVVSALTGTTQYNDTADINFTLDGEGIRIDKDGLDIETQLASMRGDGTIYYDQRLDLLVNGGPVEKLQDQLGGIGDILGQVTDGLVKYNVTGTTSEPEVKIRPLGLGG